MGMIFCYGCAKQIHETAESCPHCGATQVASSSTKATHHWSSLTSFVSGIVAFLMATSEPDGQWSTDAIVGGIIFGTIPVCFGLYSLYILKNKNRWMAVTGLVLGIVVILVSLGSK